MWMIQMCLSHFIVLTDNRKNPLFIV